MAKQGPPEHSPPSFLGYLCIICLLVTLVVPLVAQWLNHEHEFWKIWEFVGVIVTGIFSIMFWIYEFIDKRVTLGKKLDRLTSALGVIGALLLFAGEWESIEHESSTGKLLLLAAGAGAFSINTALFWRECKRQNKAKEVVLRYKHCFQFSDFPTFATFVILVIFTSTLDFSPKGTVEHHHEVLAFVSGAVAFQVAASNIAYTLEFFPTDLYFRLLRFLRLKEPQPQIISLGIPSHSTEQAATTTPPPKKPKKGTTRRKKGTSKP